MASNSVSIERKEQTDEHTQKSVRCKNCGFTITSPAFAVEPHEHTFRNPAGYSFHVLCYSDAPGAAETGDPTTADSWFANHAWTFAVCLQCHQHLGWWFNGSTRFAGLIATRLVR